VIKNKPKEIFLLILLFFILIIVVLYICFGGSDPKESIATKLVDDDSVAAIGINFKTGKSIAIDPYSEMEIKPCKKTYNLTKKKNSKENENCNINEAKIIAPQSVLNTIKESQTIFEGFVIKNGEKIPAKFTLSVSALYEGSMCHTYWSAGDQLENCVSVKRRCNSYVKNKIDRIENSADPEGLKKQCKSLNNKWPSERIE
jgi:hypothetical protein